MPAPPPGGERLDSWKEIAAYLQRDAATARRWEKTLGLPVRRVAGAPPGGAVFAYTAEIDAWLTSARTGAVPAPPAASPPRLRARWAIPTALAVMGIAAGAGARILSVPAAEDLRIEVTAAEVIARDSDGVAQWHYRLPVDAQSFPGGALALPAIIGGDAPIVAAVSYSERVSDRQGQSGRLLAFDARGQLRRAFTFDDEVTIGDRRYSPPWVLMSWAPLFDREGAVRLAVAAHHYIWSPSIVTLLDGQLRRQSTFRHDGWIESVQWMGPGRLLVAGFSNPQDGGMVALLDPATLDAQQPVRKIVLPRTEINRVTASPFNRASVQVGPGRIMARTDERPAPADPPEAVYEFTPSLDLIGAHFSDRYWEVHRALEQQGLITHSREACPDREGPREILVWEPATGWRTETIRR